MLQKALLWLKGCLGVAGRGSSRRQTPGGAEGPPQRPPDPKGSWWCLRVSLSETLAQPGLGAASPGGEPGVAPLPEELHLLTGSGSREAPSRGPARESPGPADPRGPAGPKGPGPRSSPRPWLLPWHHEFALRVLEGNPATAWFCIFKRC